MNWTLPVDPRIEGRRAAWVAWTRTLLSPSEVDEELVQLNAIKDALDPNALLNPGKGVPTLKRCQEYRAT